MLTFGAGGVEFPPACARPWILNPISQTKNKNRMDREGARGGGEMTQTLYAHMSKKKWIELTILSRKNV
jgi:hypothetical protein